MLDQKYRRNIDENGKVIRKGWKDYFQADFMQGLIILLVIGYALFSKFVYPADVYSLTGFLLIIILLIVISIRMGHKDSD